MIDQQQAAGDERRVAPVPYGAVVVDRLVERVEGPRGLVLRRWVRDDAQALARAVGESREHLRPWMPWVAHEPSSVDGRRALIAEWERAWLAGGDVLMGIFLDGSVVGGCGLHRRMGPGGLEIGYWTHPGFLRRGIATSAAWLLTDAAFAQSEIARVEIHHDKANTASAGVPRKLGFRLVREVRDKVEAPSEVGISCEWQLTRNDHARRQADAEPPFGQAAALIDDDRQRRTEKR